VAQLGKFIAALEAESGAPGPGGGGKTEASNLKGRNIKDQLRLNLRR
jgi:hypothetical protein